MESERIDNKDSSADRVTEECVTSCNMQSWCQNRPLLGVAKSVKVFRVNFTNEIDRCLRQRSILTFLAVRLVISIHLDRSACILTKNGEVFRKVLIPNPQRAERSQHTAAAKFPRCAGTQTEGQSCSSAHSRRTVQLVVLRQTNPRPARPASSSLNRRGLPRTRPAE